MENPNLIKLTAFAAPAKPKVYVKHLSKADALVSGKFRKLGFTHLLISYLWREKSVKIVSLPQ